MFFKSDRRDEERDRLEAQKQFQASLAKRFEVIHFVPEGMATAPFYIRDKETGVEYLHLNGAITPLLTPDGKPKVRQ